MFFDGKIWLLVPAAALFLIHVQAVPIDNSVIGEPEVQCGPESVSINFNTENPFEGHVYVKGLYNEPSCKVEATTSGSARTVGIDLGFGTCGVRRERSLNPRGIFVSTVVVIKFHPTFVTKVAQAIKFQCFYMEADKTVESELGVSEVTTRLQTLQVPMPVCTYDILDGGPNGNPIRFALIGQQVYHQWTCESDSEDTFCMQVYNCYVDDTAGDEIQLLDEDGCALDKYLLNNLEYPEDLVGGREAHVFKYADRASLYFNCQIRITIKEPGQECPRPQCREPQRGKRAAASSAAEDPEFLSVGIVDVSIPNSILVGDIDLTEDDIPQELIHPSSVQKSRNDHPFSPHFRHINRQRPSQFSTDSQSPRGLCMSPTSFAVMLSLGGLATTSSLALATLLYLRKWSKK